MYICQSAVGTKYRSALYTSTVHFCKVCDQDWSSEIAFRSDDVPALIFENRKKFPQATRVAQGPRIDFLPQETKYSLQFLIRVQPFAAASSLRCFSRLNTFVPSVFGALRNVSWRCCYWTRSGCNYVTALLSLTIDTRVGKEMFALLSIKAER